jgi:mevalonate kinase
VPLTTLLAEPREAAGVVQIKAPNIGLDCELSDMPEDHPLAAVIWKAAAALKLSRIPACTIQVTSSIPIAGGMGSGAAVSVAILRAFSALMGHPLSDEQVSELAYQVEVIHHGTPSGIDNTVITYARPVYFIKGKAPELLQVKQPFTLVIGDTGVQSSTAEVVGVVRQAHEKSSAQYEQLFDAVGKIAETARQAIESGSVEDLGPLMDENHALLVKMGVSSPQLDRLVLEARSSCAMGAKLSGAGRGGNMIALVRPETAAEVAGALRSAGAVSTITTTVNKG